MSWDTIITYAERFQTIIAGGLAIGAAWIAYLGALKQARAVTDAEHQRALDQRRAVAGALWAELANIGAKLFADSQRLRSMQRINDGRLLDLKPIDVSVFQANLSALGTLPPDDALVVTQAYKLILDLNQRYAKLGSSPGIGDGVAASMGDYAGNLVHLVRATLKGLRTTAGMPEDKANAAMAPWTPVVRSEG